MMMMMMNDAGQTAIFRCFVSGEPLPTVEWSMGDWRPVMASDRVRQYVDKDGSHVMELDDTRSSDAGLFTAIAGNEFGSCLSTAELVVETKKVAPISLSTPLQDMCVQCSIQRERYVEARRGCSLLLERLSSDNFAKTLSLDL